jgi:hypothetical protein
MQREKGIVRMGASLLWRRQRVLWWLFAANVVTGLLATAPVSAQLRMLDSSRFASDSLYHQMNLYRLTGMMFRPEGISPAFFSGSTLLVWAYFVFLLFAMGGVLESLYTDRTPSMGDFLRGAAEFFWRMVRLLIVFAVLSAPLLIAQNSVGDFTDWLSARSDSEQLGFWVTLAAAILLTLIGLAVRVWIDIAQLDAVAHDRRAVRRSLKNAWNLLRGSFARVYGAVLAIQFLLLALTLALLWIWLKIPHEGIGRTFLLGEVIVLLWLGFRLWQKAAETAWYHRRSADAGQTVMFAQSHEPMLAVTSAPIDGPSPSV